MLAVFTMKWKETELLCFILAVLWWEFSGFAISGAPKKFADLKNCVIAIYGLTH
jgi:hypothetical protein